MLVTPELDGTCYPRRRDLDSEGDVSLLRLRPANSRYSLLCHGLQSDGSRDDVERTMTHDEPMVLRFGQKNEAATLRPLVAVRLGAKAPQGRDPRSGPRDIGKNEGCLTR